MQPEACVVVGFFFIVLGFSFVCAFALPPSSLPPPPQKKKKIKSFMMSRIQKLENQFKMTFTSYVIFM